MASIQPNPLDRLAAYFKPCTGQFSQDCYNIEDTLTELRERQQKNPLNNLDAFFRPITKKYDETDYHNDKIWAPHNPFAEKIEIGDSVKIAKIKSSTSNKRRKVDSFDDENKFLPSLSTATTSSDASSSESTDNDEDSNDNETLPSSGRRKVSISQGDNDVASEKKQIDENIIENLETLHLISDNSKTETALRKIAKPKLKKQLATPVEVPKLLTAEKKDEKFRLMEAQPENADCKEKDNEVLRTTEGGKNDQKMLKKCDAPETHRAGFTGNRAHKYLDILDNQAFKARHQKIITKRFHETNLSSGLSSLLSDGFKPAQYDL